MVELFRLGPKKRFSKRAEWYAQFRPAYPGAALDALLAGLPGPAPLRAADLGAGTGISSRLLADRGLWVLAIEPNEAMRRAAQPDSRICWLAASAERLALADRSVDLLLCAQSFHWFEPKSAMAEFRRVLRPGGRLALIWNLRDDHDPVTAAYGRIISKASGSHPAERLPFDPETVEGTGHFTPLRRLEFPNKQILDRQGLIGRALSASYVPSEEKRFRPVERELEGLLSEYADERGRVVLRYVTRLFLADRLRENGAEDPKRSTG